MILVIVEAFTVGILSVARGGAIPKKTTIQTTVIAIMA